MKLHIGVNEDPIDGYLNIDPVREGSINASVLTDLTPWVAKAECRNILAANVLDFVPATKMVAFLEHLTSKLRRGGEIIVGGTDLYSVCLGLFNDKLTIPDANLMIYGNQQHAWGTKHGAASITDIENILSSFGITITKKVYEEYSFYIQGTRQ